MHPPRDISTGTAICYSYKCELGVGFVLLFASFFSFVTVIYCLIVHYQLTASCFGLLGILFCIGGFFSLMDAINSNKRQISRQRRRAIALRGQRELAMMAIQHQREIDRREQHHRDNFQDRARNPPPLAIQGNRQESIDEGYSHSPLDGSDESSTGRENYQVPNRNLGNDNADQISLSESDQWI